MTEAIPFFSDPPLKAIPAVQRLFDEAQGPGYSLPVAYSNLVSRLNAIGVAAPARKYVKQWLAAVALGRAARPEMPAGIPGSNPALAPTPGYFENLPEAAMPALMAAWDAIQAEADPAAADDVDERAFEAFFDAMLAIGHMEPSWRGFVAYAKAVRLGQVERPARQIAEDALPAADEPGAEEGKAAGRKRRAKVDVFVEHPETDEAVRPEVVAEIDEEARAIAIVGVEFPEPEVAGAEDFVALTPTNYRELVQGGAMPDPVPVLPSATVLEFLGEKEAETDVVGKLRSLRDDLVATAYAALQANMRRRATQIVAGQLRAMADEMEGPRA
ncbi:hypothetical protein [Shinella sp.]|jgi:hypothetical protein|uniref:hypothetical protein n=1 Tax=Shinella sp. TaxID=1870904 RepID=UPI003F70652F